MKKRHLHSFQSHYFKDILSEKRNKQSNRFQKFRVFWTVNNLWIKYKVAMALVPMWFIKIKWIKSRKRIGKYLRKQNIQQKWKIPRPKWSWRMMFSRQNQLTRGKLKARVFPLRLRPWQKMSAHWDLKVKTGWIWWCDLKVSKKSK